jgi:hypothetical protein
LIGNGGVDVLEGGDGDNVVINAVMPLQGISLASLHASDFHFG